MNVNDNKLKHLNGFHTIKNPIIGGRTNKAPPLQLQPGLPLQLPRVKPVNKMPTENNKKQTWVEHRHSAA